MGQGSYQQQWHAQSPDQRRQIPSALTVPLHGVGAGEEAELLEDLEGETVMVERVEAVLLLLLVAGAVTVT
jgi:hypothetical protein